MATMVKNVPYRQSRYAISARTLPKSLSAAAGILKHKRKALEKHVATVRREWA